MESEGKINLKLSELQASTGHQWIHVKGFNAITGFDYGSLGNAANFNPGFGYPVKIFVDTATGEVKVFAADFFKVQP